MEVIVAPRPEVPQVFFLGVYLGFLFLGDSVQVPVFCFDLMECAVVQGLMESGVVPPSHPFIGKSRSGRYKRVISYPQLVRTLSGEAPIHQISWRVLTFLAPSGRWRPAFTFSLHAKRVNRQKMCLIRACR